MMSNHKQIEFKEVNNDNFRAVVKLTDTLSDMQKRCVAPNVVSIAQAYLNPEKAWVRAIYLDETPIGFVMLNINPDDIKDDDMPALYVWRFMIGGAYQSKGYGKMAMDMILEKARKESKKTVYLSCGMEYEMPYQFYMNYGFTDTKIMHDDEEVLKIYL